LAATVPTQLATPQSSSLQLANKQAKEIALKTIYPDLRSLAKDCAKDLDRRDELTILRASASSEKQARKLDHELEQLSKKMEKKYEAPGVDKIGLGVAVNIIRRGVMPLGFEQQVQRFNDEAGR
jgi:hypothetical protein